jgi:type IV pilus assembly protein PilE
MATLKGTVARKPGTGRGCESRFVHVLGMTLIELMIVLAILGILAATVYPSYQQVIRKAHRSDAATGLYEISAAQERFHTDHGEYATDLIDLGWPSSSVDSPLGYFVLTLEVVDEPAVTFRARAVPRPDSDQARDLCQRIVINESGPDLIASSDPNCWGM